MYICVLFLSNNVTDHTIKQPFGEKKRCPANFRIFFYYYYFYSEKDSKREHSPLNYHQTYLANIAQRYFVLDIFFLLKSRPHPVFYFERILRLRGTRHDFRFCARRTKSLLGMSGRTGFSGRQVVNCIHSITRGFGCCCLDCRWTVQRLLGAWLTRARLNTKLDTNERRNGWKKKEKRKNQRERIKTRRRRRSGVREDILPIMMMILLCFKRRRRRRRKRRRPRTRRTRTRRTRTRRSAGTG